MFLLDVPRAWASDTQSRATCTGAPPAGTSRVSPHCVSGKLSCLRAMSVPPRALAPCPSCHEPTQPHGQTEASLTGSCLGGAGRGLWVHGNHRSLGDRVGVETGLVDKNSWKFWSRGVGKHCSASGREPGWVCAGRAGGQGPWMAGGGWGEG